jgi:outer membrane protein assembly factor BamB
MRPRLATPVASIAVSLLLASCQGPPASPATSNTAADSGHAGGCDRRWVFGGVVAVDPAGTIRWKQDFGNAEGNLRASAAVADMNGDGSFDVVLPAGCFGAVHAFDGQTGAAQWTLQLGPRTQSSPSIGDLDGDGALEIVLASYDGRVYVIGARP